MTQDRVIFSCQEVNYTCRAILARHTLLTSSYLRKCFHIIFLRYLAMTTFRDLFLITVFLGAMSKVLLTFICFIHSNTKYGFLRNNCFVFSACHRLQMIIIQFPINPLLKTVQWDSVHRLTAESKLANEDSLNNQNVTTFSHSHVSVSGELL